MDFTGSAKCGEATLQKFHDLVPGLPLLLLTAARRPIRLGEGVLSSLP